MMRRSLAMAVAVAGWSLLLAPAAHAVDAPVELRALLPGDLAKLAPGCALAVFQDGRLRSLVSDGYGNLEQGTPLDGDSVFYAASISKQFTALALVQLSLQGKLALDGDLRQWLPELPAYEAVVTPRMLLHHSSGIFDSLSLVRLGAASGAASTTSRADTLALLLAQARTNFKPGTATSYSNGAYLLAAELVQRVSGMSFANYVDRHILAPLGMHDSYMLDGEPGPSTHRAHGYVPAAGGYEIRDSFPRYGGSGGLMLSLNDLARYEYDIEHGHRVWTSEVRQLMEMPGKLDDGSPTAVRGRRDEMAYAMGLRVGERNGRRIVEHGGSSGAFRHTYTRVPAQRFAVAVFCNHPDGAPAGKADAAISLLLGPTEEELARLPAPGVYRAATLPARYLVTRNGEERITLAILPDGRTQATSVNELQYDEDHDEYRGDGLRVAAVDANSIRFGTERAWSLSATRLAECCAADGTTAAPAPAGTGQQR